MASDGDRKDRKESLDVLDGDVESWDAALDEWDSAFDSFAAPDAITDSAEAQAEKAPAGPEDPLVDLISGEMELPGGEEGEALGTLLGSTVVEEPTPAVSQDALEGAGPAEIGLHPDEVTATDAQVEISTKGWQVADAGAPSPVHEEPTPAVAMPVGPDLQEELTPPVSPPVKPSPKKEEVTSEVDIDSLMDGIEGLREETGLPETIPETIAAKAPITAAEAARTESPIGAIEAEADAEPPSLDVFDEIVPPSAPDEEAEPAVETIEAGDLLPKREDVPPEIPLDLEEEDLEEEPPVELPTIPDELLLVDLTQLDLPERGEPSSPARLYWERLGEHLQREADLTETSGGAAALELCVAHASEEIGEIEEAVNHYREVLNHQPGHVPAMRALQRLYAQGGEPDQVAELLQSLATRVGDREKRATLLSRAELLWSTTGDDAGARAVLDEVDQIDPAQAQDLRCLLLRADLAAASGDDEELADHLSSMASKVQAAALKSSLLVEAGRSMEVGGKMEEAKAAYLDALTVDTSCSGAVEGLARVACTLEDPAGQARALGIVPEGAGRWGARRLRRQAALVANHKLGGVDPVASLKQASALASDDPLVLEDLAHALRRSGDVEEAVGAYTALAGHLPETSQQALALLDAAILAEDKLEDLDRAGQLYERAASLMPESANLADRLKWLRMSHRIAPQERVAAHKEAAEGSRGEQRAVHHLAAARIHEQELGQREPAIGQLLECLEHDPSCRIALSMLERNYRQTGREEDLAAVLDTAAETTESPVDATEYRLRSALLYEGKLMEPERALPRYREILEVDGSHSLARLGLLRNLTVLERWDELLEAVAKEADASTDDSRCARLWSRHGDLLMRRGRSEEAEASFKRAMEKAPDHLAAAFSLVLASAKIGRWSDVAEIWGSWLEATPEEDPRRKGLLMRLAALQEFELDEPAAALSTYENAVADPHRTPGAMEGLFRILRQVGQTERLARELERELAFSPDPKVRFAILIAAGELTRRAGGDWSEAEKLFERAMAEVPGHPVARRSLEDLYTAQMAWQPFAEMLAVDLEKATEPAERIRIYERLADIDLRQGDTDGARRHFEAIVDLDPSHLGALRFLKRIYLDKDWVAQEIRALRLEARQAQDQADASALWAMLGKLLSSHPDARMVVGDEEELDRARNAKEAFAAALEANSSLIFGLRRALDDAWQAGDKSELADLYLRLSAAIGPGKEAAILFTRAGELGDEHSVEHFQDALANNPEFLPAIYYLRDLALRTEQWEVATVAAEAEAVASLRPEHRAQAALLAGELAQAKLGDTERAMSSYLTALKTDPSDRRAYGQLRDFLEQEERWPELADLLESRARIERSRVKLTELHRRLASVARDKLNDRDRAKLHLRVLLKLNKEDPESLSALADLYTADDQWTEAANALIRLARLQKDPEELGRLFLELGRIYQDRAPDRARAVASLKKVVTLDPDDPEALRRLSQAYLEDMQFEQALETATTLLEKQTAPEDRVATLLRIAKIHEDGLKDSHRAAIAYREALEVDPMDLDAIGEVIGFFVRQGDQRSLMVHLDRSVATMRARLKFDPFEDFAYKALFKIFGWRKAKDGCFCAAQVLDALGMAGREERNFLASHQAGVGSPGSALGDTEYDDWIFHRAIPGGFRQVFNRLTDALVKPFPLDPLDKKLKTTKSDRLLDIDHPVRRIADALAGDFGLEPPDLYVLKSKPSALKITNDPVAILMGKALLHEVTEEELRFFFGRAYWIIRTSMILPASLIPEDMTRLMAGIVRQYSPEFQPEDTDPKALREITKKVGKAIPRKLKKELEPFAWECSSVDLQTLGATVIHSANCAGLITCRSVVAALTALCKMAGHASPPSDPAERARLLKGNPEAEELVRYAVSDLYFELRRAMHVAVR